MISDVNNTKIIKPTSRVQDRDYQTKTKTILLVSGRSCNTTKLTKVSDHITDNVDEWMNEWIY